MAVSPGEPAPAARVTNLLATGSAVQGVEGAARPLTGAGGLADTEVAERIEQGLTNDAGKRTSRSVVDIVRSNVLTPFNALLGGLALVVMLTGALADTLFGVILVANSLVGIVQELRAKRTLDRLAVLSTPRARVIRNGRPADIAVADIVLDDLLELRAGDQVPADGRAREVDGLEVDESLLTGESDPVPKQSGDMVLSGSIVVAGSGRCQVAGVGAASFARRLADEARRFTVTQSEMVDGINRILKYVAIAIVITAPILFVSQSRTTATWQEAVRGAVAGLVGMVPEGLVLLASVTFFAATLVLARRRVLVQELRAVEGLARIDVLCLDKTGTLTEGRIVFAGLEDLDSGVTEVDKVLAAMAADAGANATMLALRDRFPTPPGWAKTASVAFSSARKWSAVSFEDHGTWVIGAPEMVRPGTPADDPVRRKADRLAASGSRTLLLAWTSGSAAAEPDGTVPEDLAPVALVTFEERVRPDAAETLHYFDQQGVAIKIISGDNPQTVGVIADKVHLPGAIAVIDARRLPEDTAELAAVMTDGSVFGRVTPQQKRAMVAALQSQGHVVAMTGDGVNDALALKDADIGVAMGSGAAATRAVAQLVLLDSEFSVLPGVVAEGRRVIANVERVANLFLTKNVSSLVLALSVAVARWPFPFLPRHLTLVSTVAIGVPGFFLALGPSSQRFTPGFVHRVLVFAVPSGIIVGVGVMIGYGLARAASSPPDEARTAATIVFFMASMWVLVIQARPLTGWRVILVVLMVGLGLAAFVIPFGRRFYDLHIPPVLHLGEALLLGVGAAFALEVSCRILARLFPRR